jgi:hypothetical protein
MRFCHLIIFAFVSGVSFAEELFSEDIQYLRLRGDERRAMCSENVKVTTDEVIFTRTEANLNSQSRPENDIIHIPLSSIVYLQSYDDSNKSVFRVIEIVKPEITAVPSPLPSAVVNYGKRGITCKFSNAERRDKFLNLLSKMAGKPVTTK